MENNRLSMPDVDFKMKCRFFAKFPKETGLNEYEVQMVNQPILINGRWSDMEIILLDMQWNKEHSPTGSTTKKIFELSKKKRNLSQILFNKPIFSFDIDTTDPTGVTIEKWRIHVKKIAKIDFGELSYADVGLSKIALIIKPSKCELIEI